jgi:outer membrane autotransporter protein
MKKTFLFVIFFLTLLTSNSFAEFKFVQTKDVSTDTPGIRGINFKPDGTRMYITNREADTNAYLIEYSLTTPFDISTATISFTGGTPKGTALTCAAEGVGQMNYPHAIEFNPDGTRMFITTNEGIGSFDLGVWQFKLTTPWDSTSLVCEKIYEIDIDDAGGEDQLRTLHFKPDGTRMFIGGKTLNKLRQYDLANPFDLRSGVTPRGTSDSLVSADTNMRNILFNPDGTQLFIAGNENTRMNKYTLSTAYDVTTLSSTFTTFDLGSRVNNMMGFIFASNFTKLFVTSDDGSSSGDNQIHEYDIDCAGTITCSDPSANSDVKAIIEANVESAKRIIKNNTLPIFHRTEWLRRHKNKDNLSNLNAEIDFTNQKIAKLASALNTLKKEKDRTYSSNDWFEWSEGRISFGKKDANDASSRDIHSYGFSIGADRIKKEDRDSMYGYVLQYGNDNIDIGSSGTNLNTDSYSLALYGTKLRENQFFTDSVIGLSLLNIDHKRVINGNTLKGDREGQQIYGSINFGKRLLDEKFNFNPGIKLDLGYTKLKAFREKTTLGNSLADSLIYKEQNIKSALATIGVLFDTTNQQEEKTTNHHGRLEYVGDLSPSSNAEFYYVNNQNTVYEYKANNKSKHNYRIGYGFDVTSITGWSIVTNFERFGAPGKGYFNEFYLLLGYVPIDEMKFTFELDDSNNTSLEFANKINEYDLKITSNYNFFSDIPDYSANILISNNF